MFPRPLSVLVNGVPSRQFRIRRGLRQGCPLSPFLFNLVAEALSHLFHEAVSHNLFKGIKVGYDGLLVSHLQYADDTIIFCEPVTEQLLNVKRVLRCFQVMSGLKINFQKSSLFGIDVEQQTLQEWADMICCKVESLPVTYLGLPLGARSNSTKIWEPVVAKFEKRLAGWKSNLLSMGGRVTMLKSVLASLPIYFLSLFQISVTIKEILDKIQRKIGRAHV